MAHEIKNLNDMMEMPKEGILSISVTDNEYYKVVLFMMPTGQYLSPHTSTMPATVQVLRGAADFTLGEEVLEVKSGDYFYMPPNFNHAIKSKDDFVFLLVLRKS